MVKLTTPQTSSLANNLACMVCGPSPSFILVKCLSNLPVSTGNGKNVVLARHVFVISEIVVRFVLLFRSFFCAQKNSQLSLTIFSFGAQKRTRTSTPYGTRT
jgi:hypothetical protein